jgi:hypothetical protein
LGLLSPFIVRLKCLFQVVCVDSQSHPTETQIHAFSDASNTAYAAVVYTRSSYENGNVQVRLVASKSKVAPIKKQSIPRLELLGAVILTRLVNTLLKRSILGHCRIFYWVDSTTVLCWIKNDVCVIASFAKRSKVFLTDHQPHLNYQNFVYLMPHLFLILD